MADRDPNVCDKDLYRLCICMLFSTAHNEFQQSDRKKFNLVMCGLVFDNPSYIGRYYQLNLALTMWRHYLNYHYPEK